jgi:thiol-disulfide isomerase/thioredoxin
MKKIFTAIALTICMTSMAQDKTYDVSKDTKSESLIFKGLVTFDDLNNEPTFTWLKTRAEAYQPNDILIRYLHDNLRDYSLVVFLGTWCSDSHEIIPKLEKVLQLTGFPETRLRMYGVDREKTSKHDEEKRYRITLVPTIIILTNDGKEVGRITETINKSIEEDIASFLHL